MRIDYGKVVEPKSFHYDLCIIGAGVAGIICAAEASKKFTSKKIVLIESGDFGLNSTHNYSLKKLQHSQLPITQNSREFTVGGTSSTWGGVTSHFEEFEIKDRKNFGHNDWPIRYDELVKYYKMASLKYGFANTLGSEVNAGNFFEDFHKRKFLAHPEPINYKKYLPSEVDLIFNAHVKTMRSNQDLVERIDIVQCERKVVSSVYAQKFILSAGGIETIKLLLNSLKRDELQVGKERALIGKFFMNHPKNEYGEIHLSTTVDFSPYVGNFKKGLYQYTGISLPRQIQINEKLLNHYVRFEPILPWKNDKWVGWVITFLSNKKAMLKLFFRLYKNKEVQLLDFSETGDEEHLSNLKSDGKLKSFMLVLKYLYYRLTNKRPNVTKLKIRNYQEMEPRFENCIELTDQQDTIGNFQVKVNHQLSQREKDTMYKLHHMINQYLKENQLGKLNAELTTKDGQWAISSDAAHHMGGTIMGSEPENSVVNSELRMHSLKNVYIASSSVFPTSGSQNPTYTIGALACMLIDKMEFDA